MGQTLASGDPLPRQALGKAAALGSARRRLGAAGERARIRTFDDHRHTSAAGWLLPALALLGAAAVLALDLGLVRETLRGAFFDPDDAMRLAEVRAWLAGQSWYDMRALRLDPPDGSFMHWSRLVDMPMAAGIAAFSHLTDRADAERWAAVAVPTMFCVLLFFGTLKLATRLMGARAALPTTLGLLASGPVLVLFAPGRIGHHAPETIALVFAVGAAVAALDEGTSERVRARHAFGCGALVALSLAMSLETMPFDIALIGVLASFWVVRGPRVGAPLAGLAAGLLAALPLFFLLDVGPSRWLVPSCDAYGAVHLGAGIIGASGLLACVALGRHLRTVPRRLMAAGVVAALALLFVATAFPTCLASPFAAVDPLVRDLWLSHVVESLPLPAFRRLYPMTSLALVGTIALGIGGCGVALLRRGSADGPAREGFVIVASLSLLGLALAFWQVRVLTSVVPLALCGGVSIATRFRPPVAAVVVLLFGGTTWALILPDDQRPPAALAASQAKAACLSPDGLGPLAALPPGTAVAPLDTGSHLIAATPLSVFAAPYHRNDDGNRFALDVFLASPDTAQALLAARRVTYVVVCPGIVDLARLAARAPEGLAAHLGRGEVPAYLKRVPLGGTPYLVYAVAKG